MNTHATETMLGHDHSITAMYVMSSKMFEKSRHTEKLGEQDVLLAPPNNFVGGATAPPAPPVPGPMVALDGRCGRPVSMGPAAFC